MPKCSYAMDIAAYVVCRMQYISNYADLSDTFYMCTASRVYLNSLYCVHSCVWMTKIIGQNEADKGNGSLYTHMQNHHRRQHRHRANICGIATVSTVYSSLDIDMLQHLSKRATDSINWRRIQSCITLEKRNRTDFLFFSFPFSFSSHLLQPIADSSSPGCLRSTHVYMRAFTFVRLRVNASKERFRYRIHTGRMCTRVRQ